jgi:hypothetical protein
MLLSGFFLKKKPPSSAIEKSTCFRKCSRKEQQTKIHFAYAAGGNRSSPEDRDSARIYTPSIPLIVVLPRG